MRHPPFRLDASAYVVQAFVCWKAYDYSYSS